MRYDPPRLREPEATPENDAPEQVPADELNADAGPHGPVGAAADERRLSVLGPTLVFKGTLTAGEDLLIQGRVEGTIEHHERNLTIGPRGSIKADTRARNIIVQGEVEGDLFASESISVEASANVRGNIVAPRVALKEGAQFKGSVDMEVDSTAPSVPKPATTPGPAKAKPKRSLSNDQVDELLE